VQTKQLDFLLVLVNSSLQTYATPKQHLCNAADQLAVNLQLQLSLTKQQFSTVKVVETDSLLNRVPAGHTKGTCALLSVPISVSCSA
jgi:hypothetical protein